MTKLGNEPGTFLLGVNSANHSTALPCYPTYIMEYILHLY